MPFAFFFQVFMSTSSNLQLVVSVNQMGINIVNYVEVLIVQKSRKEYETIKCLPNNNNKSNKSYSAAATTNKRYN